jgi:hypothetical protein
MSFTFGEPADLTGLENALAWGQGQGQLAGDDNWSDVQRAAFAAIAGSFGFTDANQDGSYEYDGITKGPTGEEEHKLVGDALNSAAHSDEFVFPPFGHIAYSITEASIDPILGPAIGAIAIGAIGAATLLVVAGPGAVAAGAVAGAIGVARIVADATILGPGRMLLVTRLVDVP